MLMTCLISMWKHIGANPQYVMVGNSEAEAEAEGKFIKTGGGREPLDWSSSAFGLFMGLLSLVALIITLIVYFALVNQVCPNKAQKAVHL